MPQSKAIEHLGGAGIAIAGHKLFVIEHGDHLMNCRPLISLCFILILRLTSPFALAEPSASFVAEVVVEDRPILLGDVFYARVLFKNTGAKSIFVQTPHVGITYTIKAGRSEYPGQFDAKNIFVSDHSGLEGFDDTFVGKSELGPGKSFSEVCLIRAVAHVSNDRYPTTPGLNTGRIEFDAHAEFSQLPVGQDHPFAQPDLMKVREVRRGETIQIPFTGLAVDQYADFRAIHGGLDFGRWKWGLLATDSLSRNVSKWQEVRKRLHPDSNLLRLIQFIESYQAILSSDRSEEEKFDAAVALLKGRRPMERDWLRPRLRNQLAIDLSDVFYKRQRQFNERR